MKMPVVHMIFDRESIDLNSLEEDDYEKIDCSDLTGIHGYCDKQAGKIIRKRIAGFPLNGIHFFGSNNYHYISKFWIDRIRIPFSLVLLDHHSDMQPGMIKGLLSCGNWVKFLLDKNSYLQKVFLIGTSNASVSTIKENYPGRWSLFSEKDVANKYKWKMFFNKNISGPLYVSIDKDVLSSKYAVTGWDQGKMNLSEMKECLTDIYRDGNVIGTDVCGDVMKHENVSELMRVRKVDHFTNRFLIKVISHLILCLCLF